MSINAGCRISSNMAVPDNRNKLLLETAFGVTAAELARGHQLVRARCHLVIDFGDDRIERGVWYDILDQQIALLVECRDLRRIEACGCLSHATL
jgi:hypothetical protein